MAEMGHKHRISVLLSPAFMSEMATIPTEFCAPQRKSLSARFRRFDLTEYQNRLDGSPRSESGKPARHISAIAFILGPEALAERRLLIGNYGNVKKEPERRAVAEEMPVSEEHRLTKNDGNDCNINRIAHKAI